MTDFWRELRDARSDDPNRPGFRISNVDGDDGGFMFVPDELLVSGAAADLLPVLQDPEYTELTDTSPGLSATAVRWFSYSGAVPLLDHVAALQADARNAAPGAGVDPDTCRVTPHYVMSGEPWIYKGGPFDEVRPAEPWSSGPLMLAISGPHVAVLDTGIPIETPGGGMARLRMDPDEDVDRLWPPGQDGPSFGAEAGHGGFIAGLVNRMTSSQAGIVALRVLDTDGYGTEVMVVDGLHRLRAAHPTVGVINLSLGTRTDGLAPIGLTEAIEAWPTSTVFVAAAGNCGVADLPVLASCHRSGRGGGGHRVERRRTRAGAVQQHRCLGRRLHRRRERAQRPLLRPGADRQRFLRPDRGMGALERHVVRRPHRCRRDRAPHGRAERGGGRCPAEPPRRPS